MSAVWREDKSFIKHSQLSGRTKSPLIFTYHVPLLAEQLSKFLFAHGTFVLVSLGILVKGFLQEMQR